MIVNPPHSPLSLTFSVNTLSLSLSVSLSITCKHTLPLTTIFFYTLLYTIPSCTFTYIPFCLHSVPLTLIQPPSTHTTIHPSADRPIPLHQHNNTCYVTNTDTPTNSHARSHTHTHTYTYSHTHEYTLPSSHSQISYSSIHIISYIYTLSHIL